MTPTHILVGYVAVSLLAHRPEALWAAVGSSIPDLPVLYYGARALYCRSATGHRWFYIRELLELSFQFEKNNRGAKTVTSAFHSYVIWTPLLAASLFLGLRTITAFTAGAVLHIVADSIVHRKDAHHHFWPVWNRPLCGLFSFWENGNTFLFLELIAVAVILSTIVVWSYLPR